MIAGGTIHFGADLLSLEFEQMRNYRGNHIAYVFQDPNSSLHPLHNIGDQIVEAIKVHDAGIRRRDLETRAIQLLNDVRIANPERVMESYPHELSGGMRQRIGIAMALANDPELIIADEPTTALDVTVQAQILHILNRLRRERGLALLFISHDMNVIAQISDRIAVMYAGQIVEAGPTKKVLGNPGIRIQKRSGLLTADRIRPRPATGHQGQPAAAGRPPTRMCFCAQMRVCRTRLP